tara:strand:+ start:319 stop:582 length:264 start_codon:yes stop_codon:yes gene_type:complete
MNLTSILPRVKIYLEKFGDLMDTRENLIVPGLILGVYFAIASCHETEMRNCERIEEREVTCCVDYEYGRSGPQCIGDGICIKEVCVD